MLCILKNNALGIYKQIEAFHLSFQLFEKWYSSKGGLEINAFQKKSSGKIVNDGILYKMLGIRLKAFLPYSMDANVNKEVCGSDVSQDWCGRKLMSFYQTV